ncbi:unnamed protein product [marine sediment metagenome]|uniref:Uncharacterized protein n=1 Tax=marine sediment metagenome TaxID=412755 RepID=X0TKX4_9ZZZZ
MLEDKEEKKREEAVGVMVIEQRGKSKLVQTVQNGIPRRYVVDAAKIKDGKVASGVLKKSPEVGEEWAEMVEFKGTPDDLDRIMRINGLFTREDVQKNPGALQASILALHREDMLALKGIGR